MGWQGLAGLFFLSEGGGTSISCREQLGLWSSEGPAGLDVPDGSSGPQGEVAMAGPLKGWGLLWLSVTSAEFYWSKSHKAAWIQRGGGMDSTSEWGSGVHLQGGQELMATTFGGKLPPRTRDSPHSSSSCASQLRRTVACITWGAWLWQEYEDRKKPLQREATGQP